MIWKIFHRAYLRLLRIVLGMKTRMRNHFRAHQLSVWLRLIPELHRSGMKDVIAKHNLFRNHNDGDLYDGSVRPDPLTRTTYYDPTLELYRRPSQNVTLDLPQTTMDTLVATCVNAISSQPGSTSVQNHSVNTNTQMTNFDISAYSLYSTTLSLTIAAGCFLLIINVLVFAWLCYRKDKNKAKNSQEHKNCNHDNSFDNLSGKQPHYFMGHSQSSSAIVDVDQDKNSIMMTSNIPCSTSNEPHFTDINPTCQNICMIQKASPRQQKTHCTTLPRKVNYSYQQQPNNQVYNTNCMTLPKNITFTNAQKNLSDINYQPNGSVGVHMSMSRTPPPPRSNTPPGTQIHSHHYSNQKTCAQKSSRMPQVAISEMNVWEKYAVETASDVLV